jgi:uncharacterized protein (DUF2126 family)
MSGPVATLARRVESEIQRQGLKLTMGGEPTFIPRDPDGPEWNNEAMGPQKLGYARRLASRFLRELCPGGLVMQVFGKQYPGEPLPRWVVVALHRPDDVPMWRHPELLGLDGEPASNTAREAQLLVDRIAAELRLQRNVLPCVEEHGAAEVPRGWVLPLDSVDGDWVSDLWPFSSKNPVVLIPGQVPLGLRLPLAQLESSRMRRALTVEATAGALHVFIPPLDFDTFCALTQVIERAVLGCRVSGLVLCGYRPNSSPKVTSLGLAADPGVLEINLPPSLTWEEYDRTLRKVTAAAEREGLVTTRLHLNGQVQGTGGGAHILFGGPTLEENPFFERPAILSSILRYWQHHPALSYFFSGQYVGPGSQAPRADETLPARLYELEGACLGAEAVEGTSDRGVLDRLFHNLLTDSAGNTHLAEISIDKLWNFDSPTGLQGLIELRAFETMPDVGDQSLSALFVRSVIAMLAARPCTEPLVRHGGRLHDRYMLPAALWEDLGSICNDLRNAGLPFERSWLRSIFETRFPVLGRLRLAAGDVVIRQALEPWPLMAETASGGATSRMVDNSTDRVQVSLSHRRFLDQGEVLVNGIALRFREIDGMPVLGVRYKAAAGWPALHPHVPVQSPLRIEVIDGSRHVIGGARYHFWNPDAPRYAERPRDLEEAESRARSRWRPLDPEGDKPIEPITAVHSEESEYTLDLRRQKSAIHEPDGPGCEGERG